MKAVRWIGSFCVVFVAGLYPGYVATILWNWFVTKAFGVPPISYGVMLGLLTLVTMMRSMDGGQKTLENRFKLTVNLLRLSAPPENQAEIARLIEKSEKGPSYLELLAWAVIIFFGSSFTLFVGWVIHHFLVR